MLLEELGNVFYNGLGMKIGMRLGSQEEGGAHVEHVQDLDEVLLFAMWVCGNGRGIECASICQAISGAGRSIGS